MNSRGCAQVDQTCALRRLRGVHFVTVVPIQLFSNIAAPKKKTMKRLFSTRVSDGAFSFAMLLLRLGAGSLMMVNHGLDKLMHFADKASRFADPFGVGSTTSLSLVVFAEFFCAVFIILGLFTRLAAIPLVVAMSVALFYAHKGQMFGDGEMSAVYLTAFLTILFAGPGNISLDKFIGK